METSIMNCVELLNPDFGMYYLEAALWCSAIFGGLWFIGPWAGRASRYLKKDIERMKAEGKAPEESKEDS